MNNIHKIKRNVKPVITITKCSRKGYIENAPWNCAIWNVTDSTYNAHQPFFIINLVFFNLTKCNTNAYIVIIRNITLQHANVLNFGKKYTRFIEFCIYLCLISLIIIMPLIKRINRMLDRKNRLLVMIFYSVKYLFLWQKHTQFVLLWYTLTNEKS